MMVCILISTIGAICGLGLTDFDCAASGVLFTTKYLAWVVAKWAAVCYTLSSYTLMPIVGWMMLDEQRWTKVKPDLTWVVVATLFAPISIPVFVWTRS